MLYPAELRARNRILEAPAGIPASPRKRSVRLTLTLPQTCRRCKNIHAEAPAKIRVFTNVETIRLICGSLERMLVGAKPCSWMRNRQ